MPLLARLLAVLLLFLPAAAQAAERWTVVRVTRDVSFSRDKAAWEPVRTGMTLPNGAWITTGPRARLQLSRGTERVSFQPDTTASIRTSGVFTRKTTVEQTEGELTLEIEKRSRPHTYVETPYLAAVVKGTVFTVTVNNRRADVSVERGLVQVTARSTGQSSDVGPGQSASVDPQGAMSVAGPNGAPSIDTPASPAAASTPAAVSSPTAPGAPGAAAGNGNGASGNQGNGNGKGNGNGGDSGKPGKGASSGGPKAPGKPDKPGKPGKPGGDHDDDDHDDGKPGKDKGKGHHHGKNRGHHR